jgi:hypothetical protein
MFSDEKQILMRVVENFVRTGTAGDEHVKVTCLPDNKTSYVEQVPGDSRSVLLDEYKVDGKVVWAGYSGRSATVYISAVTGR